MMDDRFHNEYGTMTDEARWLIDQLTIAIRPILETYRNDIDALIFLREALTFLQSDVSEYVLLFAMRKKRDKDE